MATPTSSSTAAAAPANAPPPSSVTPAATAGDLAYGAGTAASGATDTSSFPGFDTSLASQTWQNAPGKGKSFTPVNYNFDSVRELVTMLDNLEAGRPAATGVDARMVQTILKDAGADTPLGRASVAGIEGGTVNREGFFGQARHFGAAVADETIRDLGRNPTNATENNMPAPAGDIVSTPGQALRAGSPAYKAIEGAIQKQIKGHLDAAGLDTSTLGAHPSAAQISQLSTNPIVTQRLEAEGYKLDNVATLGSLLTTLQSGKPQQENLPGAAQPMTAQSYYADFQKNWASNASYKAAIGAALSQAGYVDTASPTNAQAGAAILKLLKETAAAGGNYTPDTFLQAKQNATSGNLGKPGDPDYEFVRSIGNQFGVALTDGQINALSAANPNAYQAPGASDTALRAQIADMYKYDPNQPQTGYAAVIENGVAQAFGDMGVPLSPPAKGTIIQNILTHGNFTSSYEANLQATDAAHNAAKQQALALYPAQSSLINQGLTIRQIADPYLTVAQNVLGLDPASVDITDPKWGKVLQGNPDGTPVNLFDWQAHLRTDPTYGWNKTQNARDTASSLAQGLASSLGLTGAGQNMPGISTQSPTG